MITSSQDLDSLKAKQNLWYSRINSGVVAVLAMIIALLFLILFVYIIVAHQNTEIGTNSNFLMVLSMVIPFFVFPILMITLIINKLIGLSKKLDPKYIMYRIAVLLIVAILYYLIYPK